MNKYTIFLILTIFVGLNINAQLVFQGQVFEKDGITTIPFANVSALPSGEGTTTDIDGNFSLSTYKKVRTLTFSFMGYESFELKVKNESDRNIIIKLGTNDIKINETVVIAKRRKIRKDTAAITLYRNVVKHKEENRPKGMESYHFKEHIKYEFDLYKYNPKLPNRFYMKPFAYAFDFTDTTEAGNWFVPGLLIEELKENYYQKSPNKSKEILHANMGTGLENLSASIMISDVFEKINMYDNMIEAGGKPFASPFSTGGILTYRYFLSDSITNEEGVKLFRLDFSPRNKQGIAFNGYAWIETENFAITEMEFRIPKKANLNFISDFYVKQSFTKPDNEHWFLTAEELHIAVNPLKSKKGRSLLLKKRTRRQGIELNIDIPAEIFEGEAKMVADSVENRSPEWWVENRIEPLTQSEINIGLLVDSIQRRKVYTNVKHSLYAFASGYIRFGKTPKIEFGQFNKFVSSNNVEGVRLKFGARTNKYLSRDFQLTVYGAYATKLAKERNEWDPYSLSPWSYLANLRVMLPRVNNRWQVLEFRYSNDYRLLGSEVKYNESLTHDHTVIGLLRDPKRPIDGIMKVLEYNIMYEKEWFNGFSTELNLSHNTFSSVQGTFDFKRKNKLGEIEAFPSFTIAEIGLATRIEVGKNFFENEFIRTAAGSKNPQIEISYNAGFKGILGGDYTYHKFGLRWFQRASSVLGFSKYQFRAGYALGDVPYPLMFLHRGNESFYWGRKSYSIMQEAEYVSDRYAAFWIDHHFDGKILNSIPGVKLLQLRSILLFKVLVGDVRQSNKDLILLPSTIKSTLQEDQKVYIELGFGIENILKFLRLDFVWRLTQSGAFGTPHKEIGGTPVTPFAIRFAIQPKL